MKEDQTLGPVPEKMAGNPLVGYLHVSVILHAYNSITCM